MPDDASADAPGRVNLIGEHTDYHDGYALPTVIPQRTRVVIRPGIAGRVRAASNTFGNGWEEYRLGGEEPGRGWVDYVQGVTVALKRDGLDVPGFDLRIDSTIPAGAGLASSAALEVSVLRGLRTRFALPIDQVRLAAIAHVAETEFVGAPVGIMDQMAVSLGRPGEALFLDTRTLETRPIPLPAAMELIVIHSGVTHSHAGGEYATRRRESFEAARLLGVSRLRDLGVADLTCLGRLPVPLAGRARHVVTENERVLAAVDALEHADLDRLGELFDASHASMRDDYGVSTPDIDVLVRLGDEHPDLYGARSIRHRFRRARTFTTSAPKPTTTCRDTSRAGTWRSFRLRETRRHVSSVRRKRPSISRRVNRWSRRRFETSWIRTVIRDWRGSRTSRGTLCMRVPRP
jgi:galactokinase